MISLCIFQNHRSPLTLFCFVYPLYIFNLNWFLFSVQLKICRLMYLRLQSALEVLSSKCACFFFLFVFLKFRSLNVWTVHTLYRVFFFHMGIICKDFSMKSLDYSADMMNKKGRVNCSIKKLSLYFCCNQKVLFSVFVVTFDSV